EALGSDSAASCRVVEVLTVRGHELEVFDAGLRAFGCGPHRALDVGRAGGGGHGISLSATWMVACRAVASAVCASSASISTSRHVASRRFRLMAAYSGTASMPTYDQPPR